jgi:Cdc6-like AAA superfamily ATPase
MYNLPPYEKKEPKLWLQKSLYMIGRKRELEICKSILNRVYKQNESEMFLIRGVIGSGKSLFVRKLLYEFIEENKDLKSKSLQYSLEYPYTFVSYQLPTTFLSPFNGWKTIFKQVYNSYFNKYIIKNKIQFEKFEVNYGSETFIIEVDPIGKILFKVDGYNCLRYIEEILEVNTQLM